MKFKKGDIVQCIDIKSSTYLVYKQYYIIKHYLDIDSTKLQVNIEPFIGISSRANGYWESRFIKVNLKDIPKEIKFKRIKYKLGAK